MSSVAFIRQIQCPSDLVLYSHTASEKDSAQHNQPQREKSKVSFSVKASDVMQWTATVTVA